MVSRRDFLRDATIAAALVPRVVRAGGGKPELPVEDVLARVVLRPETKLFRYALVRGTAAPPALHDVKPRLPA